MQALALVMMIASRDMGAMWEGRRYYSSFRARHAFMVGALIRLVITVTYFVDTMKDKGGSDVGRDGKIILPIFFV